MKLRKLTFITCFIVLQVYNKMVSTIGRIIDTLNGILFINVRFPYIFLRNFDPLSMFIVDNAIGIL